MSIDVLKQKKIEQKTLAIRLRKKGMSYSEIRNSISVPKSTLSYWLKNIKLSSKQAERLKNKRAEAAQTGAQKKSIRILDEIKEIQKSSEKDIGKISKRELWLMGLTLYWRERFLNKNDSDLQRGVRFTSSDPALIKFFLKWLYEVGGLEKEEINFDVFMAKNKKKKIDEAIKYWGAIADFSKGYSPNIYLQKVRLKKTKKKSYKKSQYGFLRVRVKASSMLARQISGWIKSVQGILSSDY